MYNVQNNWGSLKVCAVGKSYPPEFYDFIEDKSARDAMQLIASETNEDLDNLENLLHSFGVQTIRPEFFSTDVNDYLNDDGSILPPPMAPCDISATINNNFYFGRYLKNTKLKRSKQLITLDNEWAAIRGEGWPANLPASYEEYCALPEFIISELNNISKDIPNYISNKFNYYIPPDVSFRDKIEKRLWKSLISIVENAGNAIHYNTGVAGATTIMLTPAELLHGTHRDLNKTVEDSLTYYNELFPGHVNHVIEVDGHIDGVYSVVGPTLLISRPEPVFTNVEVIKNYTKLIGSQSAYDHLAIGSMLAQSTRRWFSHYINNTNVDHLSDFLKITNEWFGQIDETYFEVNNVIIDEHNIIMSSASDYLIDMLKSNGVTAHISPFRHSHFWDCGIHCATSSIDRG